MQSMTSLVELKKVEFSLFDEIAYVCFTGKSARLPFRKQIEAISFS